MRNRSRTITYSNDHAHPMLKWILSGISILAMTWFVYLLGNPA